jgi:hypothetical protein
MFPSSRTRDMASRAWPRFQLDASTDPFTKKSSVSGRGTTKRTNACSFSESGKATTSSLGDERRSTWSTKNPGIVPTTRPPTM